MNLTFEMKPGISKLVLCGIGGNQMDKDKTLRDASVQALVINGSKDNLVNGHSEKVRESFRNLLPPTSREGKGKGTTIRIPLLREVSMRVSGTMVHKTGTE